MTTETETQPEYPEHEKLSAIQPFSQAQGEFSEWLRTKGIILAEYDKYDELWPCTRRITDLLAEYHGINQSALEAEKRAMLDKIRSGKP